MIALPLQRRIAEPKELKVQEHRVGPARTVPQMVEIISHGPAGGNQDPHQMWQEVELANPVKEIPQFQGHPQKLSEPVSIKIKIVPAM